MAEHGWEKQRIQLNKGIMYQGKNSQGDQMWRTLSDNNPTKDLIVHKGSDMSIGTQPEEEGMQMQQVMESSE